MKPSIIQSFFAIGVTASMIVSGYSQTPPGIPEPGITIYGTAAHSETGAAVTITSVSFGVTDGTKTFALDASSKPATRITSKDGKSYYVVQIPFDTRTIGTGANRTELADPAEQENVAQRYHSFPLASSGQYTVIPVINGVPANIKAVNGSPLAESAEYAIADFRGSSERGRLIRIDLSVSSAPVDSYDAWASTHFGDASSPEAQRDADPDGDGSNNAMEHAAGTDPNDASSLLRILTFNRSDSGAISARWSSVSGKRYQLERSADLVSDTWQPVGAVVTALSSETDQSSPETEAPTRFFYRVRIISE